MKKILFLMFVCLTSVATFAQDQTITFDKYTHNFGSFPENNATQTSTPFFPASFRPALIISFTPLEVSVAPVTTST